MTYPCFYIIQSSLRQCELFWHKCSLDDTRSCYQSFLGSAAEPKFKTFLVHESLLIAISPSSNHLALLDKKIIFIYLKVIPVARPEVSIIEAIRKWLTAADPALIPAGPGIWGLFFPSFSFQPYLMGNCFEHTEWFASECWQISFWSLQRPNNRVWGPSVWYKWPITILLKDTESDYWSI